MNPNNLNSNPNPAPETPVAPQVETAPIAEAPAAPQIETAPAQEPVVAKVPAETAPVAPIEQAPGAPETPIVDPYTDDTKANYAQEKIIECYLPNGTSFRGTPSEYNAAVKDYLDRIA